MCLPLSGVSHSYVSVLLIPMFFSFPCLSHGCFETWGPQLNSLTSANPYLDPPNPILGPGRFPCLSHSNVSLMPMSLSCLCLSHSYVSPIPLSISFPCLFYSPVSLIPLSLSFLCLSQSFASSILMSHFHVFPIPMSVLNNPPSLDATDDELEI